MNVSVSHELLVSETLVCFFFFMFRNDLSRGEIHRLSDSFGYNELKMSDFLL
jgi:hypothetical protein